MLVECACRNCSELLSEAHTSCMDYVELLKSSISCKTLAGYRQLLISATGFPSIHARLRLEVIYTFFVREVVWRRPAESRVF